MIPACYPVPPAQPGFAPSRQAVVVNEVIAVWWASGPDQAFTAQPPKPTACRVPCRWPCPLPCPRGQWTRGALARASEGPGGRLRAEGPGLDLSLGHFGTQHGKDAP